MDLFNFKKLLNSIFYSNATSDDFEIGNESTNDNLLDESFQNTSVYDEKYFGDENDSNNSYDDTSANNESSEFLDDVII